MSRPRRDQGPRPAFRRDLRPRQRRTAHDGSERILAVLNVQNQPQSVEVDLSGVAARAFTDPKTGNEVRAGQWLEVSLPAFGAH